MPHYLLVLTVIALLIYGGNFLLFKLLHKTGLTNIDLPERPTITAFNSYEKILCDAKIEISDISVFEETSSKSPPAMAPYVVAACIGVSSVAPLMHIQRITAGSDHYVRSQLPQTQTSGKEG